MITQHTIDMQLSQPCFWIDLCEATLDERARGAEIAGFALEEQSVIREIEFSSRVRYDHGTLYLNLPRFHETSHTVSPIGFALSSRALVTLHEQPSPMLAALLQKQLTVHSTCALFLLILENFVDMSADRLEALESSVIESTRFAFDHSTNRRSLNGLLRQVGGIGQQLGYLHGNIHGLLRLAIYLDDNAPSWFDLSGKQRVSLIRKDLLSLIDFEQQLDDRTEFLLESVLGLINTEQNEIMKVMAIGSVVGIPPTVLVGIWGMNFSSMPELHWHHAYFYALGIIILSLLLPFIWFRHKGWL